MSKQSAGAEIPGGVETLFMQIDDIQLFPIPWCFKRLYIGPDDNSLSSCFIGPV